jgi:hypothetical protein
MMKDEQAAAKKYIDEKLSKGLLRSSTSSISSPVIPVKKPEGGLRFCVDFQGLERYRYQESLPDCSDTANRG